MFCVCVVRISSVEIDISVTIVLLAFWLFGLFVCFCVCHMGTLNFYPRTKYVEIKQKTVITIIYKKSCSFAE